MINIISMISICQSINQSNNEKYRISLSKAYVIKKIFLNKKKISKSSNENIIIQIPKLSYLYYCIIFIILIFMIHIYIYVYVIYLYTSDYYKNNIIQ